MEHRQSNLSRSPGETYNNNMDIIPLPNQQEYQVPPNVARRPHGGPDQYCSSEDYNQLPPLENIPYYKGGPGKKRSAEGLEKWFYQSYGTQIQKRVGNQP